MNTSIFTTAIKAKADAILANYETKRASILEVMRLLQEEYGSINLEIEKAVAEYLEIPAIDVHEVVTFYTIFYREPKAQTRFNICRTLSCALLGGEEIVKYCEQKLGIKAGEKTPDGKFSIQTVECLGACEIAPMLQLNDEEYIGPLTKEKIDELINRKQQPVTSNQ
jgi:NADH-quinone oxidoreductase E subunit